MPKCIGIGAFPLRLVLAIAFGLALATTNPGPGLAAQGTMPYGRLDFRYDALTDLGAGSQGYGQAFTLAWMARTRSGSYGLALGGLGLPASMTELPSASFLSARIGYAAVLAPGFSVGAGLSGAFGDKGGFGWNAALELGAEHLVGDLGIIRDFSWGFVISGIGISGGIPLPSRAVLRSLPELGIDPGITLKLAAHGLLLRRKGFDIGLGLGLVSPGFSDIGFFSSLDMTFKDRYKLEIGWDVGWKDVASSSSRSLLPSIGLSLSIPLGVELGIAPLYGQVLAARMGLGLSWGSRIIIEPVFPDEGRVLYISPDGDGVQDEYVLPLSVRGAREAGAWEFRIADSSRGSVIRTIRSGASGTDSMQGMRRAGDSLALAQVGVAVPEKLVIGTVAGIGADSGIPAGSRTPVPSDTLPDGSYSASFIYRSIDGEWVLDHENFATVVVDRTAPEPYILLEGDGVFSPDADGRKDSLRIDLAGAAEAWWKFSITDDSGTGVFSREWTDSSPYGLVWTGLDADGRRLPDGRYRAKLEARDSAGNTAFRTLEGITIDTRSPKAALDVGSASFSPNGDGIKDELAIIPRLESGEGLLSCGISVLDGSGFALKTWDYPGMPASGEFPVFEGMTDKGDQVEDGKYRAVMRLTYGNGHEVVVSSRWFEIDTIAPVIRAGLADTIPVFSPDGDGRRDELAFTFETSDAGLWKLGVLDLAGNFILLGEGSGKPSASFVWTGRDSRAKVQPNGDYRFELRLVDEAGNAASGLSPIFSIDVSKPRGTFSCERQVFSPDGDGVLDTIELVASFESASEILSWAVSVRNTQGGQVWALEREGGAPALTAILLDGVDASTGRIWDDGRYRAELTYVYRNGHAGSTLSPWFSLDTIPPEASVEADRTAINPLSEGAAGRVRFVQTGSAGDTWTGEVLRSDGTAILEKDFGTDLPSIFEWGGTDASGRIVQDGLYAYRLSGGDTAGHRFVSRAIQIQVDTSKKTLALTAEPEVFSPDGDGVDDTVEFDIAATGNTRVSTWLLEILSGPPEYPAAAVVDSGASTTPPGGKGGRSVRVRKFAGKGELPRGLNWDGKTDLKAKAADGPYSARVSAVYPNGDNCESNVVGFVIDTYKPVVFVKADAPTISPDGDGYRDELGFTLIIDRTSGITAWSFSIVDADKTEKIFFRRSGGDVPGRLVWDGRDETGSIVRGQVFGKLAVNYDRGKMAEATSETIRVEDTAPRLEVLVMPDFFSPDGDGLKDMVTFLVEVDTPSRVASWSLEVLESHSGSDLPNSVVSTERLFRVWSGNGAPPVSITWDGRNPGGEKVEPATDYPFRMRIRDKTGNTVVENGIIAVDVLVVREGSRIRINIPSIEFGASGAGFSGLDPKTEARNQRVLARLIQILQRFPGYRIRIEGHANNEARIKGLPAEKIAAEEKSEIIPLSLARAGYIRDILVARGFDPRRFTVAGMGSSFPVVDPKNAAIRWKNRRVEFILVRDP